MKSEGGLDSVFFGAASGFETDVFEGRPLKDAVPGTGVDIAALQAIARRQLVGSIVVALLIAVASAFMALRPAQETVQALGKPAVHAPTFHEPTNNRIAALRRYEVP